MYVTLTRDGSSQNFNVWVYGDGERLLRGSGIFVPETRPIITFSFPKALNDSTLSLGPIGLKSERES
jgi:hypothetical protein